MYILKKSHQTALPTKVMPIFSLCEEIKEGVEFGVVGESLLEQMMT